MDIILNVNKTRLFFVGLGITGIFTIIVLNNNAAVINLYIAAFVFLGTYRMIGEVVSKKGEFFNLDSLVPATFVLYGIAPFIIFQGNYSEVVRLEYMKLHLIAMLGFLFGSSGFSLRHKIRKLYSGNACRKINFDTLKLVAMLMLFLSIVSIMLEVRTYGGLSAYYAMGYGGSRYLMQGFTVGASFQWSCISSVLFGAYGIKKRRIGYLVLAFIMMAFSGYTFLRIGGRSTIIYTIIFGTILWHYGHKKIPKKILIIGILAGYAFAQVFSIARYHLPAGIMQAFTKGIIAVVKSPSLLLPFNIGEFVYPGRSLFDVLTIKNFDFKYGMTYLAGGGFGFSPVAEGYINFGYMGSFLHMALYGWIGSLINRKKQHDEKYILLYAGMFPMLLLDGLRIYSASFVYKLMRVYILPYILYCCCAKIGFKKYK